MKFDDAVFQLKNLARGGASIGAQQIVERRALELAAEFPALTDLDVATLVRDEVLNTAGAEPALLAWATEETVARLRRTLIVNEIRWRQQAPERARLAALESERLARGHWSALGTALGPPSSSAPKAWHDRTGLVVATILAVLVGFPAVVAALVELARLLGR